MRPPPRIQRENVPNFVRRLRPLGQFDRCTMLCCDGYIKGNLFVHFFRTKDYKWYINEIDALFHINSTIIPHPHNDNICVTKDKAVLSIRRVEPR